MTLGFSLEPSLTNNVFVPDQLIAGSHQIVTDTVTIASGQVLTRGTLIGQQTASQYATVATPSTVSGGTNAGAETIGSISTGVEVKQGAYRVNLTSTTAFNVLDPTGELVGTGTVGTAFTSSQINLTVTTGSGIAANDGFTVLVEASAGSGNQYWVAATATATDGSEIPENWAILAEDTNTSSTGTNAATAAPVYLAGEFDTQYMTFGTGLTAQGVKNAFRQAGAEIYLKVSALTNPII